MLQQFRNICHQNYVPPVRDPVLEENVSDRAHGIAVSAVHALAIGVIHESVAVASVAVVVAEKVKVAVVGEVAVEVDEVEVAVDEVVVEADIKGEEVGLLRTATSNNKNIYI